MNGILLAGLTDHEAAAIEIMIGMNWRDQRCVTLPRGLTLGIPAQREAARACGSCVVDLFGFGMRRHAPEHEQRLLEFLDGRSAVVLVWGTGGGWLERKVPLAAGRQLEWVTMPYTSADMRDALKKIRDTADAPREPTPARPTARAPAPAPTRPEPPPPKADAPPPEAEPMPAWRRAMALAEQLKRKDTPSRAPAGALAPAPARAADPEPLAARRAEARAAMPPVPKPPSRAPVGTIFASEPSGRPSARVAESLAPRAAVEPPPAPVLVRLPDQARGLRAGGLALLLDVFPDLRAHPLTVLTDRIVRGEGAQLLRLAADVAFVANVQQGWVAAGLPASALLKLLHTPHLVEGVTVLPLPADDVEETLRQRFGGSFHRVQKPLDVITWELMSDVLKNMPLAPKGDLTLQLQRFPNFTLLADVGPLDVQLAAICARTPQTLSDLARAFPRREQAVFRFAVLCIASGLAVVTPAARAASAEAGTAAAAPRVAPAVAAAQKQQAAVRRGFFKSLLDKLF